MIPRLEQRNGQDARPAGQMRLTHGDKRGWRSDWIVWAVNTGLIASLQKSEVPVLWVLLSHASLEGHSYPSVDRIAAEAGRRERAVQLALKSLEQHPQKFLKRIPQGFEGRNTDTFIFQPFEVTSYSFDYHATEAHESAPGGRTNVRRGGAQTCAGGRTNVRPNSVRNKVSEIIVERRDDDEEILSSQDKAAEPTGLFDGVEAVQAMVEDFEFNERDAQQHVRRYGSDAVIQTLQKAEYYRKHNKPVNGKPVANWRGFIVTDLKNGFPQDPQVLEAARKAQCAEAAKVKELAKEERDRAEMAKQAQDIAFVEMVLANKSKQELESLREQVALAESAPMIASRQRKRALDHPALRKAMADLVMNDQAAAGNQPCPSVLDR